jgi:hypothetical protein
VRSLLAEELILFGSIPDFHRGRRDVMPKGVLRFAHRTSRRHRAPVIGVLHTLLGTRTFGEWCNQTPLRTHTHVQLAFTHLHNGASHGRFCR